MSITREQQADLYRGDTLELKFNQDGAALTLRGTFPEITNFYDNYLGGPYTLTVVSRAPRPLYVNHDRTEPVPGDVVRDAKGDLRVVGVDSPDNPRLVWWGQGTSHYGVQGRWTYCSTETIRETGPAILLVDGETGQVVP